MGLIGAVHFLLFALVQIPAGALLDRYEAGRVQSALLVIAAIGSALCASSDNWIALLTGRALIGVGVSGALRAGLRWIAQWCPPHRLALANGVLVALGTMWAVSATVPLEWVLDAVGWHGVFGGLALVALLLAICVHTTISDRPPSSMRRMPPARHRGVLRDRTFLRVAPLFASCLGTAWAFQSLWAAPWLADVEQMPRNLVVGHMLVMACGLVCGALFLGLAAHRLRSVGARTIDVLAGAALLLVMLEVSILFRIAPPTYVTWGAIGAFGSISVLSFTVMSERFCVNGLGSANAPLNLMHMLTAFGMQWAMGAIVGQWQPDVGVHYPAAAYFLGLSIALTVQLVALVWFAFLPAVWRSRDDQRGPQPAISPGQPSAGAS